MNVKIFCMYHIYFISQKQITQKNLHSEAEHKQKIAGTEYVTCQKPKLS